MQYLCFDLIYEHDVKNGENTYWADLFLANMQVDKIKCRFTKMVSLVVVLPVLQGRLQYFQSHFIFYFTYVFY